MPHKGSQEVMREKKVASKRSQEVAHEKKVLHKGSQEVRHEKKVPRKKQSPGRQVSSLRSGDFLLGLRVTICQAYTACASSAVSVKCVGLNSAKPCSKVRIASSSVP